MIVLKHLSREFDIDPYKLRQFLRLHNVKTHEGRYQWENDSPELIEVRQLLSKYLTRPSDTSPSPGPTQGGSATSKKT